MRSNFEWSVVDTRAVRCPVRSGGPALNSGVEQAMPMSLYVGVCVDPWRVIFGKPDLNLGHRLVSRPSLHPACIGFARRRRDVRPRIMQYK